MHIHIEVGGRETGSLPDPRPALQVVALSGLLADQGHAVSLRGVADQEGIHPAIRLLSGRQVPLAADALLCVETDPPPDAEATRRIAWSFSATWPGSDEWDSVVTQSAFHKDILRPQLPQVRIDIVPPAIRSTPPASNPDRLLFDAPPEHGLHRLLEIWPALWNAFHLPLVIPGDLRIVLRQHADRPGELGVRLRRIRERLDQPGVLPQHSLSAVALARIRARSLALLHPQDPIPPQVDVAGLPILESAAAGIPVLTSAGSPFDGDLSGAVRVVGPRPFDSDAWVSALGELLAERENRSRAAATLALPNAPEMVGARWAVLLADLPQRSASARPLRILALSSGIPWLDTGLLRPILDDMERRGHDTRTVALLPPAVGVGRDLPGLDAGPDIGPLLRAVKDGADRLILLDTEVARRLLGSLRQAGHLYTPVSTGGSMCRTPPWPMRILVTGFRAPTTPSPLSATARRRAACSRWAAMTDG